MHKAPTSSPKVPTEGMIGSGARWFSKRVGPWHVGHKTTKLVVRKNRKIDEYTLRGKQHYKRYKKKMRSKRIKRRAK